MRELLGVDVPDDARGALQDIHWSGGGIGYFPTYALGNVISLQIWSVVREAIPDLDAQMEAGELEELSTWLRENLYSLGRKFTPKETIERVTGTASDRPTAVPRVPAREALRARGLSCPQAPKSSVPSRRPREASRLKLSSAAVIQPIPTSQLERRVAEDLGRRGALEHAPDPEQPVRQREKMRDQLERVGEVVERHVDPAHGHQRDVRRDDDQAVDAAVAEDDPGEEGPEAVRRQRDEQGQRHDREHSWPRQIHAEERAGDEERSERAQGAVDRQVRARATRTRSPGSRGSRREGTAFPSTARTRSCSARRPRPAPR